jgi:hypothetical protein
MSPTAMRTSEPAVPDDVPDSGSITATVASGSRLDVITWATPSPWAPRTSAPTTSAAPRPTHTSAAIEELGLVMGGLMGCPSSSGSRGC